MSCAVKSADLRGKLTNGRRDVLESTAYPVVASLLYAAADLRQALRTFAQSSGAPSDGFRKDALLVACDSLRDDYLPAHGIRLQDRNDTTEGIKADLPAIGLVDAKLLAAEKNEKAEVSPA